MAHSQCTAQHWHTNMHALEAWERKRQTEREEWRREGFTLISLCSTDFSQICWSYAPIWEQREKTVFKCACSIFMQWVWQHEGRGDKKKKGTSDISTFVYWCSELRGNDYLEPETSYTLTKMTWTYTPLHPGAQRDLGACCQSLTAKLIKITSGTTKACQGPPATESSSVNMPEHVCMC